MTETWLFVNNTNTSHCYIFAHCSNSNNWPAIYGLPYIWHSHHQLVTRIGSVARDQKVPGSNHVLVTAVWTYKSCA